MDRFIVTVWRARSSKESNLKSNMDRFIVFVNVEKEI